MFPQQHGPGQGLNLGLRDVECLSGWDGNQRDFLEGIREGDNGGQCCGYFQCADISWSVSQTIITS